MASFNTSNSTCPDEGESTTKELMRYFVSVCLAIIIIVSIIGNSMVCIAFKVNKHLRTVSNSFILSLAVSDLITTIFVMPWDLEIILKKSSWSYGEPFCKFYTTVYLLSAPASTLNLLAVSIDRFRLIRDPFAYRRQTTPFRAGMVIIFIWLYSTIMAFLPWMGWKDSTPWPKDTPLNCTVNITTNQCWFDVAWHYSIMMSVLNFVIPPLIMTAIYFKIFQIAKGHIRRIHRLESITLNGRASVTEMANSTNNSRRSSRAGSCSPAQLETHFNGNHTLLPPPHVNSQFPHVAGENGHASHNIKHANKKNKHVNLDIQHKNVKNEHAKAGSEHEKMILQHERKDSTYSHQDVTRRRSSAKRKSRTSSITGTSMLRKNVKAAKSLAIIVGTFFLCWYPFTIVSMAVNACVRKDLGCTLPPIYVEHLLLIFGFLNSMLNPFLYALHNKEFKKTYKRILRWK